jgi:hypothetical protein
MPGRDVLKKLSKIWAFFTSRGPRTGNSTRICDVKNTRRSLFMVIFGKTDFALT